MAAIPELRTICLKNVESVQPLFVSVRIAARELTSDPIALELETSLAQPGYPADALELVLADDAHAGENHAVDDVLAELRDRGVQFAAGDFGVERSSIANLAHWPVSKVIADPSLVWSLETSPTDLHALDAIASLGQTFGQIAAARGVESADQCARLVELGFTHGQGSYFGRARNLDDARSLIETWNAGSWRREQDATAAGVLETA